MIDTPTTVGIVSTLSGVAAVWYGIKRSRQVDSNTARSGEIAQIISALQEDGKAYRQENKDLKQEVRDLKLEIKTNAQECADKIAFLESKIVTIEKRLDSFIRKYGANNGT